MGPVVREEITAAAQAELINANASHSQSGLKYHVVLTRWCVAYVLSGRA